MSTPLVAAALCVVLVAVVALIDWIERRGKR